MKIFVRCPNCGHIVYTEHYKTVLAISQVLADPQLICSKCKLLFNRAYLFCCNLKTSDDCDTCEYKFVCLSDRLEDAVEGIDK